MLIENYYELKFCSTCTCNLGIKTFALPEKYAHVKTFLIYRKDLYLYQAMQNFIDLLCLIIN